jgi:hypothetical protein
MDYSEILRELYHRRDQLAVAIAKLEAFSAGSPLVGTRRRGRKSMGPEERKQVSTRMMKYWAGRRRKGKRTD